MGHIHRGSALITATLCALGACVLSISIESNIYGGMRRGGKSVELKKFMSVNTGLAEMGRAEATDVKSPSTFAAECADGCHGGSRDAQRPSSVTAELAEGHDGSSRGVQSPSTVAAEREEGRNGSSRDVQSPSTVAAEHSEWRDSSSREQVQGGHNFGSVESTSGRSSSTGSGSRHLDKSFKCRSKGLRLADRKSRLQVMAVPKGGATVSIQIYFRYLGILDEALAYDPWIHRYRSQVFDKNKEHRTIPCSRCGQGGWTCIFLLRSPFDRVVSSYFHLTTWYVEDTIRRVKPEYSDHESFAGFVDFLKYVQSRRERGLKIGGKWPDHYLPQCGGVCSDATIYIPVESLDAGLAWFGKTHNVSGLTRGNMSSTHYVTKSPESNARAAYLPFSQELRDHPPSYDSFLAEPEILKDVCSLFWLDIELYRNMCSATWLRGCADCMDSCSRELGRLARCEAV